MDRKMSEMAPKIDVTQPGFLLFPHRPRWCGWGAVMQMCQKSIDRNSSSGLPTP